ncbi:MAG TPA: AbrB/MazE/SpoVT family DNA-binding domain-containing protein [Nitrososphaerales archaeon]|nr:AbrB/MazE/SpoVT family DNA-binding domain-containing protein [Nitrososphaerales archaeon]
MMIEEEMKVGPKGQVVIPRVFRSALKIHPGSKVIVRLENDRVVVEKKAILNAATEFERIAKSGKSVHRISPHMYEEEFENRF